MKKKVTRVVVIVVAVLLVAAIALSCVTSIPTGHTGVVTTFGRVEDVTLDAGIHVKAPWQKVVKMDNRVQKGTLELPCFSSDIQEVNLVYTLNFQIRKADAMKIYANIGTAYYDTVVVPTTIEAIKVVTAKYTAEDLVGNRADLAAAIETDLSEKLEAYDIEVVSTSIENMDFTDAFTDAVEAKQVAQQNKLKAETEAQQAVIEAQAKADVRKIDADAEAYETVVKAEAEAQANETIGQSLTKEILDKMYYDKWDGTLPKVMGADNTIVNLPDALESGTETGNP